MSRKLCIVTGTRADYGLLRPVISEIRDRAGLELQLVATGMHLSPEFGLTYREIEQDGVRIDRKIEMLLSADTPSAITKSIGLGAIGFADALDQLRPDVLIVLGDRFEILAAAMAALPARIPMAHIHGGETTEGAFDESIRHAVTKMAHLHFVAAEEYRRRVVQLGEQPDRVYMVGGLGVDAIQRQTLLSRDELEQSLGQPLGRKNLLVTFHPVTLEDATSASQMTELLAALESLEHTNLVFTMPNADTDGRILLHMIDEFVERHPNARAYTSLGQLRYLSCLRHFDAVVGNSSSGLAEAPSFKKPTINIGDRQEGRLKAASVIDCAPDRHAISAAIEKGYADEFQKALRSVSNPYGDGGAGKGIVDVLELIDLNGILKKRFYDIPS
jgi:GDP/UDP-N,N'-diacetylbacillosamine 2-epimerase (hydrolysing)